MRTLLFPVALVALLLAGTLSGRGSEPARSAASLPFSCWASVATRLQRDLREPTRSASELRARIDGLLSAGERVEPAHAHLVAELSNQVVMEAALGLPVLELEAALSRLRAGDEVREAFLRVHAARWAAPPSPAAREQALEGTGRLRRDPRTASYGECLEAFLP